MAQVQQALQHLLGFPGVPYNDIQVGFGLLALRASLQQLCMAAYYPEGIVDLVRHSGGQLAQGGQLLALLHLRHDALFGGGLAHEHHRPFQPGETARGVYAYGQVARPGQVQLQAGRRGAPERLGQRLHLFRRGREGRKPVLNVRAGAQGRVQGPARGVGQHQSPAAIHQKQGVGYALEDELQELVLIQQGVDGLQVLQGDGHLLSQRQQHFFGQFRRSLPVPEKPSKPRESSAEATGTKSLSASMCTVPERESSCQFSGNWRSPPLSLGHSSRLRPKEVHK